MQPLHLLATQLGLQPITLLLGVGLGCLLAFAAMMAALADRSPAAARIAAGPRVPARAAPTPWASPSGSGA